ncbi:MAG: prolyl oligopeptidase family serine peptidase [Acidimicrobiales bacterium]
MTRRLFSPEDGLRLKTAVDPRISPDGRTVAWAQMEVAEKDDRMASSIWVAPLDGSAEPRQFAPGPGDSSPRWSPDGRWLSYVSAPGGDLKPHLRLAPLDGGVPQQLGELPGSPSQPAWSPDSTCLAVVVQVGAPDASTASAAERNAARRVRGLADRLDGVGVHSGRRHVFVVEVATGTARQLTRGEFDHADPSWSPDGELVVFASDRDKRHDDRQFRADAWVVPAAGGRPRRLTNTAGRLMHPVFSPDGTRVAFAGHQSGDSWDADSHVFTVPADGSASPEMVAPSHDRGVLAMPGAPAPYCWMGSGQIAMLVADGGAVRLVVASLARGTTRLVVGGDRQIDGLCLSPSRRHVAFTATWPDRPSEVWVATLAGGEVRQLSHMNDEFRDEVELAPVKRRSITRPDGTEVEYFTIVSPARGAKSGRPKARPLHLDIHGGPHGLWPSGRFLAFHQSVAAAGYAVLLPNPRGSTSYGQEFTEACTGDWGGADCEDILACCDDLIARGVADEQRMFVSGGSYGGFMTSWIVGHSRRFRAATAMAAVVDQASMLTTSEIPDFVRYNFGGTFWDNPDEYQKRSPLTYLPDVATPVLVVHWEGDLRVPISQGEELYAGLRLLGKQAEMLRYPGGFHIARSPAQSVDWVKQMLDWNERHDVAGRRRPRR